jgi:hypothetical protein
MIDNLDKSFNSRQSLGHLLIDQTPAAVTYHNLCALTTRIILLCFSSFYFGYSLTTLSTFSENTLQAVVPTPFRSGDPPPVSRNSVPSSSE